MITVAYVLVAVLFTLAALVPTGMAYAEQFNALLVVAAGVSLVQAGRHWGRV